MAKDMVRLKVLEGVVYLGLQDKGPRYCHTCLCKGGAEEVLIPAHVTERRQCEDGGQEWSDRATSLGKPGVARD